MNLMSVECSQCISTKSPSELVFDSIRLSLEYDRDLTEINVLMIVHEDCV